MRPVIDILRARTKGYYRSLALLKTPNASTAECTRVVRDSLAFRAAIAELSQSLLLNGLWGYIISDVDWSGTTEIPFENLLRIDNYLFVVGEAGAGKTTLLRILTDRAARQDVKLLPVFVPLVSIVDMSYFGLLRGIKCQLADYGYSADQQLIQDKFDAGQLFVCFDGLDETGSKGPAILDAIGSLVERHPECRVVVSCRDTAGIKAPVRAFRVRLRPLNDHQLEEFVGRWFKQSGVADGLLQWMADNRAMREAARTPLIAALLCSLYHGSVDMPSTEWDLYDRRLDLLLGRWERAKGLLALSSRRRRRYRMFLATIAFELHRRERRSAVQHKVMEHARRYHIADFHRDPGVYPGFPIRLGALPGFVVGDRMWKALWKLVENEQRFPRRGGRVLCVHGAVSFHRARPCGRPVCRPGRDEGSLEPYRQNCDESGLQISPPGPLRCHDLPDRGQPRYSCTDSEPFAYPVREAETAIKQASSEHFIVGKPGYSQILATWLEIVFDEGRWSVRPTEPTASAT